MSPFKETFVTLGKIIEDYLTQQENRHSSKIEIAVNASYSYNQWFTKENVHQALQSISQEFLIEKKLDNWLNKYPALNHIPKKIGVIMAGNIPLVGFHDFMCVIFSGHIFIGKLSDKDKFLLPALTEILFELEPALKQRIYFEQKLSSIDAIIATGSNNSSRYFEHYFSKYPHIIRKNRHSVAIINGKENEKEMALLGKDIFSYFGFGCRNVSKLFLPKGYDLDNVYRALYPFKEVINHTKYANNYSYNRTIYLMNTISFFDNGFLLLKEDEGISSPPSVLYFEYYHSPEELNNKLDILKENIQCIVSLEKDHVPFGETQTPSLTNYADDVDVMEFLSKI